jgi:hypothetical protein
MNHDTISEVGSFYILQQTTHLPGGISIFGCRIWIHQVAILGLAVDGSNVIVRAHILINLSKKLNIFKLY